MGDPSNQKGRALEDAVALIEKTILETDPDLANRKIRIEVRKRVVVNAVPHEIDLWVELLGPKGYDAVFVFECKAWADKVGKNEVIVFSEKVRAVQAQRGYLVAREFTSGARAQAVQDPRVRLLDVREEQYEWLTSPFSFNFVEFGLGSVSVELGVRDRSHLATRFDPNTTTAVLDGNPLDFMAYLGEWRKTLFDETVARSSHHDLPGGTYELRGVDQREFPPGALTVNDLPIAGLRLRVNPTLRVVWPSIVSSVEVVGRGRVLQLDPVTIGGREVSASILGLSRESDPADQPLAAPREYIVQLTMAPQVRSMSSDGSGGQHAATCAAHGAPAAPCNCSLPTRALPGGSPR